VRTLDTLVHVGEGLVELHRLDPSPPVVARLAETRELLAVRTVDPRWDVGVDAHDARWRPLPLADSARAVSYGHEAERVVLLADIDDALGVDARASGALLRRLMAGQLRFGEDRRRGGCYFAGPLGGPASDTRKRWWPQAESLLAQLLVHRRFGDPDAGRAYLSTLRWIDRRQADWSGGEWHHTVGRRRPARGKEKVAPWKTPYHIGRSLLRCLALLDETPHRRGA
jgi:mannose/cellobiose epimerase-like protein (N-acyl-D-glucosamine 2-epimerase family)